LAERDELHQFELAHAEYYLRLANEAVPYLTGPDDVWWRARLVDEYADIRAALTFLRDQPDRTDQVRLVHALAPFWWEISLTHEAMEWIPDVIDLPYDVSPRQRARVLALSGILAASRGDYDVATDLVDRSLACSADAGESPVPDALAARSMAALIANRPEDALRFGEEAVVVARAGGDAFDLANTLASVSNYVGLSDDDQRGIDMADEGLVIARRLGNQYLLNMCLASAGTLRYLVDPPRAIELINESFDASLRNHTRDSQSHFFKAMAHLRLKQESAAAYELCVALPRMQQRGEPYYESMALAFAAALLARRDPALSVRILAVIDRMREDGDFIGATRDLEMQALFRQRFEAALPREQFDAWWAEGRASTLDDMIAVTLDALTVVAESDGADRGR